MSGLTIAALRSLTSCVNSRSSLAVSPKAQLHAASTRTAIANRCFMIPLLPTEWLLKHTSSSLNTSRASPALALCLTRPIHTEQPDKDEIGVGLRIGCIYNGVTDNRAELMWVPRCSAKGKPC